MAIASTYILRVWPSTMEESGQSCRSVYLDDIKLNCHFRRLIQQAENRDHGEPKPEGARVKTADHIQFFTRDFAG